MLSLGLLLAAGIGWTTGCNRAQPEAAPASQEQATSAAEHDHHTAVDEAEPDDEATIEASFASLSVEDRALAEKQATCPISGERLGLMGTPIKVTVDGHDVFVCCAGCKEPLEENPQEYLVKLGLEPAAE
jgi:hypothetical protein